jgi:hypothetical protein
MVIYYDDKVLSSGTKLMKVRQFVVVTEGRTDGHTHIIQL